MASGRTLTRRVVVKTSAKLAYATPLVAATMKLSAEGVGAISEEIICERAGVLKTITGTVTDAATGEPLRGFIEWPGSSGQYEFSGMDEQGRFVGHCIATSGGYEVYAPGYDLLGDTADLGLTEGGVIHFRLPCIGLECGAPCATDEDCQGSGPHSRCEYVNSCCGRSCL